MGILFWMILFVVMGALLGKVKSYWKEGKVFNSIIWIVISLVIFCVFAFIREYTVEHNRSELKNNFPEYSINKSNDISKKNSSNENKIEPVSTIKEKTLGEMALDAPHPIIYVSGMQPIRDGEGFYIEFDKTFSNEEYGFICDYVDSKNETELRIAKTEVQTADSEATFNSLTEIQRKGLIDSVKKANISQAANFGSDITFLDDGYFMINGNVVLWVKAIIKNNDLISQTTFCYYVAKNKKIYSLQYITNSIDDKPNDTILTSLNTLRFE